MYKILQIIGGIKLIGYTMKLWERIIELRLRQEIHITSQFGFSH